jgi:2-polyprenyl-3-methyl-5-hydroxy-6-metoxy-1,4-benzoquinol methylase
MSYGEEYYKTLNYSDYSSRQDRYLKLAEETVHLLKQLNLINDKPILDFGCATGFLVKGLLNERLDAYGYDISEWAISEAVNIVGKRASNQLIDKDYGIVYFLDVLEHINQKELEKIFSTMSFDSFIFRIPVTSTIGGKYILDISEKDSTHIVRWPKNKWKEFFTWHGYTILHINLSTIYDSTGVFCGIGIK